MSLDLLRPASPPSEGTGRRLSALPVSVALHLAALLVLVVVPLLATGALPQPPRDELEWSMIPAVPTAPPPSTPRRPSTQAVAATNPDAAPLNVPAGIVPEDGLQRVAEPLDPGFRAGVVPGLSDGALPLAPSVVDAPPPARTAGPVRPGGDVREPKKVVDVRPVYPELALATRVQGIVLIEAVIAPDGTVRDARILRSHPLLDAAALDAVRQWRYTPTLLNGVPVPVIITVTVNFRLR